jgi:hypothetical protein
MRLQWWDGAAWTGQFADLPAEGSKRRPLLPPGMPTSTPFLWALLWLSALFLILDIVVKSLHGYTIGPDGAPLADPDLELSLGDLIVGGVAWPTCAASVVMAYLDWRKLKRLGVVRPFHWAWGFLPNIYVIGRTVVVRKAVPGSSIAPIMIAIGLSIVNVVTNYS